MDRTMADEDRLLRELQDAHDAVCNFEFAYQGWTDLERMVEYQRLIAAKREVQGRVNAHMARL